MATDARQQLVQSLDVPVASTRQVRSDVPVPMDPVPAASRPMMPALGHATQVDQTCECII